MSGINPDADGGESLPHGALVGLDTPASIYLLADHLDAVLAAGEDLMKLSVAVADPSKCDGASPVWSELEDLIGQARDLELSAIARTLQARTRARDIASYDDEIAPLFKVYSASTAILADAAAELADTTFADFDAGCDPLAYLRSRGVIAAEAGSLKGLERIVVGEDFLVARRIALGPLLDLTAQLLDVLDTNYGLFGAAAGDRPDGARAHSIQGRPPGQP